MKLLCDLVVGWLNICDDDVLVHLRRSYAAPDGMTPQALRGFEGHDVELAEQLRRDILETCARTLLSETFPL